MLPLLLGVAGVCQSDMTNLESIAKSGSVGRKPDGRCYSHVADYIDASGYGGIAKGGFDTAIPSSYWAEAHQFADYLNKDGNAARLNLQKMSLTNPYLAPPGAIVVVRAGTPGTVNPTAGDIAVKGGGDSFYNGGEMGYGGSGNFPAGNDYVLGIYEPTICSGSGPSPPTPGSGCQSCVLGGGGTACASKCTACGSDCINCVKSGGGKACADRCCEGKQDAPKARRPMPGMVTGNGPRSPGWWNGSHFVWPAGLVEAVNMTAGSCWAQEWQDHSCNGYLAGGFADNAEQCCTMCKGYAGCKYATYEPNTYYTCLAQPDWAAGQPDTNAQPGHTCMKM